MSSQAVLDAIEGRRMVPVVGDDDESSYPVSSPTRDPAPKVGLNVNKHFNHSMSLLLKPIRRQVVPPTSIKELSRDEVTAVDRPVTPSALQLSPARSDRSGGMGRSRHNHGPLTVSEQELSCIRRVATYGEPIRPSEALVVPLPTSNYWLRHLHDPITHRPPATPLTLENMPTDCVVRGLPNINTMPLINSPRSVLVLMKNGTNPMKLQQRLPTHDTYPAHVEAVRQEELQFLREEYRRLCAVLPQSTVSGFYEQVFEIERRERTQSSRPDATDLSVPARPTIQEDDNGIYRVVMRAEATTAERAVVEKQERSRSRIENRLRSDIQLTQARTEASKVMQKKALIANKKHDAILALRRREHEELRLAKAHAMEEKRRRRDELAEEIEMKILDDHDRRMTKNQILEENNEKLREAWRVKRQTDSKAKAQKRERILDQARQLAKRDEDELLDVIATKDMIADQITRERQHEKATRWKRVAESEEQFRLRREALQKHADLQAEIARRKQAAREAAAERLLEELSRAQKEEASQRELSRLHRTLMADERLAENRLKDEEQIQDLFVRWDEAEIRQQRLMTILDHRRQEKRFRKDVDSQDKKLDQERWDAQRQFEAMLSTDGMLTAQQRMGAVQKARQNISENARTMEMEMSRWRVKCAEEARLAAEKEERQVMLSLFNVAHPSDAVTLKRANEGSVRRFTRMHRRPHQDAPVEEPQELPE